MTPATEPAAVPELPVPETAVPETAVPEPVAPPHWEADVIASDGGTLHLRPITPADADGLLAFHAGLSERTRYLRFFSAYPTIPERDLYRFTHVDHHDRAAFVAELGGQIIAVGRYDREPRTAEAEVAFVVADAHQGRGIGSVLLEHLAAAASESGIRRFTAVVLAENTAMLRVFRQAGYAISRQLDGGEITLEFDVAATEVTDAVRYERERRAEARSIQRLLFPASAAVVGASNEPGTLGHAVFANLLAMGFNGRLYPVNPEVRHVGGVPAYPSLLEVPDAVDLVVILAPAGQVAGIVEQCPARSVKALVVMSGGFGEHGAEADRAAGLGAQAELVAAARARGMRVLGPNALGIINTDPQVRLNASLAPLAALPGRTGFFCQSGALGLTILGGATARGLGVSTFVSAGNRADVSGNDVLQFWEDDESTDVVLMYLESFGNPRKFARLSRRLGRSKPLVAVKAGAGPVVPGLRHTSVEIPELSVRALFEASGVIRVRTVSEMFDVALLLAAQPLPAGDRIAVVGNSSAITVLVRNAAAADHLSLVRAQDVGTDASAEVFAAALREAVADPRVDAVVVVYVPPVDRPDAQQTAEAVRQVAASGNKPVLSTFLGFAGVPAALAEPGPFFPQRGSVPSYSSPERAVQTLARVVRYAQWRAAPATPAPEFTGTDIPAAQQVIAAALSGAGLTGAGLTGTALSGAGGTQAGLTGAGLTGVDLDAAQCRDLLAAAGITLAGAPGPAGAGVGAGPAGAGPVGPGPAGAAPDGAVEVRFGVLDEPSFGALLSFGIGGLATDLLDDRAYAAAPLSIEDAHRLIGAPRAFPLLTGYRGAASVAAPAADLAALEELALRLSLLADELPEIARGELTVWASPAGAQVASAAFTVAPATNHPDSGPRRLRAL